MKFYKLATALSKGVAGVGLSTMQYSHEILQVFQIMTVPPFLEQKYNF